MINVVDQLAKFKSPKPKYLCCPTCKSTDIWWTTIIAIGIADITQDCIMCKSCQTWWENASSLAYK